MATITSDTTDRVAAIIGDTLNGWFQPHLTFSPIVVRQRYDDWYGEDYLEAWIVWEGDYAYMDHSRTIGLYRFVEPLLERTGHRPAPPTRTSSPNGNGNPTKSGFSNEPAGACHPGPHSGQRRYRGRDNTRYPDRTPARCQLRLLRHVSHAGCQQRQYPDWSIASRSTALGLAANLPRRSPSPYQKQTQSRQPGQPVSYRYPRFWSSVCSLPRRSAILRITTRTANSTQPTSPT